MLENLTQKVLDGYRISSDDIDILLSAKTKALISSADKIKQKFSGKRVGLCSIINGKSGNCGENCRFCAQSAHFHTGIETYEFKSAETILQDCIKHENAGVDRYSIVTSGRALSGKAFENALKANKLITENCHKISLCASYGLITYEQMQQLKASGVTRYHCNLETSENNFKNICTSHTFKDKVETINAAKRAGLEVCSGGIIGMGEKMADRIDMAFSLRELGVNSIPVNVLTPIKNTPFENCTPLTEDEILRTIAIFRFINPKAEIRLAAGRSLLKNNGLSAFSAGADSMITGDFLTTSGGSTIAGDKKLLMDNGFVFQGEV